MYWLGAFLNHQYSRPTSSKKKETLYALYKLNSTDFHWGGRQPSCKVWLVTKRSLVQIPEPIR